MLPGSPTQPFPNASTFANNTHSLGPDPFISSPSIVLMSLSVKKDFGQALLFLCQDCAPEYWTGRSESLGSSPRTADVSTASTSFCPKSGHSVACTAVSNLHPLMASTPSYFDFKRDVRVQKTREFLAMPSTTQNLRDHLVPSSPIPNIGNVSMSRPGLQAFLPAGRRGIHLSPQGPLCSPLAH